MKADLHIHSCYSNDGELEIGDILDLCAGKGVDIFSITDHNGVGGAREAVKLSAEKQDIVFIPGIEIDCNYHGTDLHLLGYQIDPESDDFISLENAVRLKYMDAVPQMIRKLDHLGIPVDMDELMQKSGGDPPSGELIGELLFEKDGLDSNPLLKPYFPGGKRSDMPLINFYLDFFAQGKPAYVKIEHLEFRDAIALVRNNGGIPIVAHPGLNLEGREDVVHELLDQGAAGLEVFNNYHSVKQLDYFSRLIIKRGALMSCGSDFHGKNKALISIGQYKSAGSHGEYLEKSIRTILNH